MKMIVQILLYIANGLIVLGFLGYIIMIFVNRKTIIDGKDGFNITKDILEEYDSINIIENKSVFTIYNIKRKVIKIASRCYYGNSVSDIAIPLMESGISGVDNKQNKYLNLFRKIISNLKYLYVLPIISIILNSITYNLGDARIGLFIVAIFSIISYMLIDIKTNAYLWLEENIKKIKNINYDKVLNFINKIIIFDKLIFFGELIMIIRFVAILLEIN